MGGVKTTEELMFTGAELSVGQSWCRAPFTFIHQIFFIYNNYKNYIINNKSDKNKILNLRMAVIVACLTKNGFLITINTRTNIYLRGCCL
jgi:hypothetical protein